MTFVSMRRLAPAVVALTLVVPVPVAAAAAPAPSRVAAKQVTPPAVTRVATLPVTMTRITSPKDGIAYVAGADSSGVVALKRWVRRPNGRLVSTAIPVPPVNGYARVSLSSGGGRTFLLVASGAATALYEVVGARLVPQALPDAGPVTGTRIVHAAAVAADGTPWVVVGVPVAPGAPTQDYYAAHRDRYGSWTFTAPFRGNIIDVKRAFVSAGRIVIVGGTQGLETWTSTWEGSTWRDEKVGFEKFESHVRYDQTTTVSATDHTRWGFNLEQQQPPAPGVQFGVCRHTVGGQTTSCPAPEWAVTAAVRLGDGRVVLGGVDAVSQMWSRAAQGGVALLSAPGAVPSPVTAEVGGGVLDLAAADRGTTVWALTTDRAAYGGSESAGLQVLQLPKVQPVKSPRPTKGH